MDPEADRHFACRNDEERLPGARKRASAISDPERERPAIGEPRHPLDLINVEPGLGRCARGLEDRYVARDAPSKARRLSRRARDVVRDRQDADVDSLRNKTLRGGAEIEDVASVVAKSQEDSGLLMRQPRQPRDAARRRRGEDVSRDRSVGEALADIAGERRIATRAAADHQRDLALGGDGTQHSARGQADKAAVGLTEAPQGVSCKGPGIIVKKRHAIRPDFDDIARSEIDAMLSPRSHLTPRPWTIQWALRVIRKNRSGGVAGSRFIGSAVQTAETAKLPNSE
jgi:hypothetical protein